MEEQRILEAMNSYVESKEGKKYLSCASAFHIAVELKVEISVIGRLCNQEKIKLTSCQMGCF